MSDSSSQDTQKRQFDETSPLAVVFLILAFMIVLWGGWYGVRKYQMKTEEGRQAALRSQRRAEEKKLQDQLTPYKIDPKTGKLEKADVNFQTAENDSSRGPDIGEFELTDRSGKMITNKDLLDQPWAVCFVFTRCAGPCLDITNRMAKLQQELDGALVRLVTITVDPKYDSPAVLKNYADNVGADPDRWLFLTGEPDYVYQLLRGYFRQLVQEMTGEQRKKGFEVFHTADVLHIDAEGRIVKRYSGASDADMTRLRIALLKEAKELAENPKPAKSLSPAVAEKSPAESEGE